MKIILRERTTGLWLKPCGRWEPTSRNARRFGSSAEAIQCAVALRLPNVDVCFVAETDGTARGRLDPVAKESIPFFSGGTPM